MPKVVRGGLIQAKNVIAPTKDTSKMSEEAIRKEIDKIRAAMLEKHIKMTEKAGKKGVQVLCYQELFNVPYFPAEHHMRWYYAAEPIPGPTTREIAKLAKKLSMVIVVPIYERAMAGVYYNSAAVIDADGKLLGTTRKMHIPHVHPGFYEKYYFKPGNTDYPVFRTAYARVAPYICYDRHFPDGARILGLHGCQIMFNPSATTAGVSKYLWELEQPAHAVANGYFVGAVNRVGTEKPWNWGRFYGSSYFCSPKGKIIAQASEDKDEIVVADLNLDEIEEIRQAWQFYRDRRPETYGDLTKLLP
ncbi:acyltransferase [bacterium]|nr:acyltransferase [bacterium]MCG2676338.1 acyltransferase [bacterium]MCG2677627.1 acyltransferase [bacterium]